MAAFKCGSREVTVMVFNNAVKTLDPCFPIVTNNWYSMKSSPAISKHVAATSK